jgi:5-methylcytosine-specific restriction endonuclease McrA
MPKTRDDVEPWQDKETLEWAYHEKDKSRREVGDLLGCSGGAIRYRMDKYGIEADPGPNREGPWRDKETLKREYIEKERPMSELADAWDTGIATISRWCDEHDLETRDRSQSGEDHWNWKGGRSYHGAAGEPRDCPVCGEEFKPTDSRQITCSRSCAAERLKDRVTKTCETCGEDFEVLNCREETARYCSRDCKPIPEDFPGREIDGLVTLECEWCGDSFEVYPSKTHRRFCGQECMEEWSSSRTGPDHPNWEEKSVVDCHTCGEEIELAPWQIGRAERRFCSLECRKEWLSEHYSDRWTGSDHPNWKGGVKPYGEGWNDTKRKKVRVRDQARCQDCGMTEADHVEEHGEKPHVHHVVPAREFDEPEERNAMANLITLCRSCHLGKWESMPGLRPDTREQTAD